MPPTRMNFLTHKKFGLGCLMLAFTFSVSGLKAADVNTNDVTSGLPSTADRAIVFDRDIRPILAASCIRCHGAEKPKSHFRLDNRLDALKGGDDNTNDIVPGNSAQSILIKYIARQVPDMDMPPPGRGDPLTAQQVQLLRDWIDQGAEWSTNTLAPQLAFAFAPEMQWMDVSGNKAKFRELEGVKQGVGGGVSFSAEDQIDAHDKASLSGHVRVPGADLDAKYTFDRSDLGFVHAGFTQWRKYYANDGGYDPAVTPSGFNPSRNLYLDNGDAWVDFGLALPNRPLVVLGYEYQYRNGTESTLDWGSTGAKNIYPSEQGVDENTHILKLSITHDIDDWHIEDHARVEFYRLNNDDVESQIFFGGPAPDTFTHTRDDYHSVQVMNTTTVEKQIRDWWLASVGFYYSKLAGSDFFNQNVSIASLGFNSTLASQQITLRRESEIFSVSSLFTPLDYLTISVGSQNEWTTEDGFGSSVPYIDLAVNTPANATYDTFKTTQDGSIRYTAIPFTVIFADAQFEQENVSEMEEETPVQFDRQGTVVDSRYDVKGGFNVSPWRWMAWNTQYSHKSSYTDYQNPVDLFSGLSGPTNGYPGFILDRQIQGDDFETKLDLHPARWLKTTLTYQLSDTRYFSRTDPAFDPAIPALVSAGGTILDGTYRMQTYGFSATVTPVQQFYLTGDFTYSHSRALTADNGDPSVVPYTGNIFTVSSSATYAWNPKTSLQASYIFTKSIYGQDNGAAGLPTGLDFTRHEVLVGLTRQITKRVSGALRYEFSQYTEANTGNLNNFTAHGIFASLAYRWP